MKVNYAGTVSLSTLDWRGKAAVTIFFRDCPLRCPYCQNHSYLEEPGLVELDFVKEQIKNSGPFVSAAVFSGGEPLMQAAIVPLAEFAKELGLFVGIHTNGCYPERAAELVERKLVDKFFIDVKAPPNDPGLYAKVAGCGGYGDGTVRKTPEEIAAAVAKTIETADSASLELELRTTLIRDLIGSKEEIEHIAAWISENVKNREKTVYVLQQGLPEHSLQESLRKVRSLDREEMLELGKTAKGFLEKVKVRTKEDGEEAV
ncbi:anaerobic ribonucleoside-triphosphate reductase activating protein [Methanosarcina sp. KYL-1]|uniref:anaerobic ribonucleoside-triphosphate reductase activating protein n=1 Tax=Methanosarcina sp. KYL-1 TaxID=2602068 RepID=UPI002100F69A|nr:anaerobic ribonucleoside-triphosphate reductase activating protein [Methanosarcina sp. KYL-1]MCQ1535997.1 anaerobic ribonucleoside-triphosphate reductase activating protein [Methanosarcina sp. KYL-1]